MESISVTQKKRKGHRIGEQQRGTGRNSIPARSARKNGYFSYENCDKSELPQIFIVRYSGDERGEKGENFLFKLLVNGKFLAVQELPRDMPNSFIDEFYPLPEEMIRKAKKGKIRLSFIPWDDKCLICGIYEIAVLCRKTTDDIRRNFAT